MTDKADTIAELVEIISPDDAHNRGIWSGYFHEHPIKQALAALKLWRAKKATPPLLAHARKLSAFGPIED